MCLNCNLNNSDQPVPHLAMNVQTPPEAAEVYITYGAKFPHYAVCYGCCVTLHTDMGVWCFTKRGFLTTEEFNFHRLGHSDICFAGGMVA